MTRKGCVGAVVFGLKEEIHNQKVASSNPSVSFKSKMIIMLKIKMKANQ